MAPAAPGIFVALYELHLCYVHFFLPWGRKKPMVVGPPLQWDGDRISGGEVPTLHEQNPIHRIHKWYKKLLAHFREGPGSCVRRWVGTPQSDALRLPAPLSGEPRHKSRAPKLHSSHVCPSHVYRHKYRTQPSTPISHSPFPISEKIRIKKAFLAKRESFLYFLLFFYFRNRLRRRVAFHEG